VEKTSENHTPDGQAEGLTSLGLRVPQQAPASPDSFLLDPKATANWFSTLPMANIGETARQIFSTLVDCNRMEMPEVVRARVIEQFREPVHYLCENLARHYVDLGLPLSAKGRKTASLARELQSELAIGYKLIIENQLRSSAEKFDEKLLVIALHRALFHLGQTLLQCALAYGPWPPGAWREIHGIYAYAAQNQVHGVPVKDSLHPRRGQSTTIEDLYKSLLVFAASDPLRLRQSQLKYVYTQAIDWARLTQIRPAEPDDSSTGRFNVDLWSDMPPVHNSLTPPNQNRRGRVIDLRGLARSMREEFERAQDAEEHKPEADRRPSRSLLRLLITAWTKPPERRFVRTHLNFELHLAVGLNAIHQAITEAGASNEPDRGGGKAPAQTFSPAASSSPRVPTWATAAPGNFSLSPMDSELTSEPLPRDSRLTLSATTDDNEAPAWNDSVAADSIPLPHAAATINESAGGYCVRWAGPQAPKVKVGEVVGIQSASNANQFGVGVVRWLKQDPARELELGLEIITPRCRAGEVRVASESIRRSKQPRHACLLLPETERGAGDTTLLINAATLQPSAELWLKSEDEDRRIELTRLIETTGAVARYEYRMAETPAKTTGSNEPRHEFDDLWSSL
jgi:hypothetical protein